MAKEMVLDWRTAAANVAYAFSDLVLFDGGNYDSSAKAEAAELRETGRTNLYGQRTMIVDGRGRDEACGAMFGAMKAGALASAFIYDNGITDIPAILSKFASNGLPGVFYVSMSEAKACLGRMSDDVGMVFPSTVQEVLDLSIAAHLSAAKYCKPFVIALDNTIRGRVRENVLLPEYSETEKIFDLVSLCGLRARALDPNGKSCDSEVPILVGASLAQIVSHYLGEFKTVTGRQYDFIEYSGAKDAEDVIIAVGGKTPVMEQAVSELVASGRKVGLLKIHVLKPFSSELFIKALPVSCKRVLLVGYTNDLASDNCLRDSIKAALAKANAGILLTKDEYALGTSDYSCSLVKSAFDAMQHCNKATGSGRYFSGISDDPFYRNTILPLLDLSDSRIVVANSLSENNITFGMGVSLALEQRRVWLSNEVLFLADNTVYPDVTDLGRDWLDKKDIPSASGESGDALVERVKVSTVCSTCMNIVSMAELLDKKHLWIFAGDARMREIDYDAVKIALSSGYDLNLFAIEDANKYKKASTATGTDELFFRSMQINGALSEAVCIDWDSEKIQATLKKAENYCGPSLTVIYV